MSVTRREERYGTRAELTANTSNPMLNAEIGIVTDEERIIVGKGDGTTFNIPNMEDFSTLETAVAENETNIAQNTSDIVALDTAVSGISAAQDGMSAYGERILSLETSRTTDEADIDTLQNSVSNHTTRITTLEADRDSHAVRISQNETDIDSLQASRTTDESNISSLLTNVAALQAGSAWVASSATWTPISVDNPEGVINVGADMTEILFPGTKITFDNNGSTIYGIITVVEAYTGGVSQIRFLHEINTAQTGALTLMNIAQAITSPKFSYAKTPPGFNVSRSHWEFAVKNAAQAYQQNPTQNTFYNITGGSLSVFKGTWIIGLKCCAQIIGNAAVADPYLVSLTSSLTAVSNTELSVMLAGYNSAIIPVNIDSEITLTTKTTFYITMTTINTGVTYLELLGNRHPTKMFARCPYI